MRRASVSDARGCVPARRRDRIPGGDTNPGGRIYGRSSGRRARVGEVWLDSRGWTRVDPTAAAVPVRFELGYHRRGTACAPLLARRSSTG